MIQNNDSIFLIEDFKELFIRNLVLELNVGVPPDSKSRVVDYITSVGTQYKLHTLFTNVGISEAVDQIFQYDEISTFVLSLTDRFLIEASSYDRKDVNGIDFLLSMIKKGIAPFYIQSKHCFIPDSLQDTLVKNKTQIIELLESNSWLITVVMIYLVLPIVYEKLTELTAK